MKTIKKKYRKGLKELVPNIYIYIYIYIYIWNLINKYQFMYTNI